MQCKDIPDATFVAAVQTAAAIRHHSTASRWDVASILAGHPERVHVGDVFDHEDQPPERVVLAKARKLVRRGVLDGCFCGCGGDLRVPCAPIKMGIGAFTA